MNDQGAQGPQEITVTCKQCGSTSMERLDRLEYKCTHCGSITVVSNEDADRLEAVLGDFLRNRAADDGQGPAWPLGSRNFDTSIDTRAPDSSAAGVAAASAVRVKRKLPYFFFVCLLLDIVALAVMGVRNLADKPKPHVNETVPAGAIDVNYGDIDGAQVALLTNTSKKAVVLPETSMTSYNGEFKLGSSNGEIAVKELLPGERTIAVFSPEGHGEANRFKFSSDAMPVVTDQLPRLDLRRQKLIHATGTDRYQLVGVVENPTRNVLSSGKISVALFDAKPRIIGWGMGTIRSLEPNEKAAVSVDLNMNEARGTIASYEYLIDIAPE